MEISDHLLDVSRLDEAPKPIHAPEKGVPAFRVRFVAIHQDLEVVLAEHVIGHAGRPEGWQAG